jgi:hypothetical protein
MNQNFVAINVNRTKNEEDRTRCCSHSHRYFWTVAVQRRNGSQESFLKLCASEPPILINNVYDVEQLYPG